MSLLKDAFKPATRRWIYNVATALYPILVVLGIARAADGGLWLALVAAVLGAGTTQLAADNVNDE